MSAAGTARSVFAPVTALAFSAAQLQDLKKFLAQRSENTEIIPISDADQLLMRADGRIAETGYRFNYFGFESLCRFLVGGLATAFRELAGETARRRNDSREPHMAAAVSIYNTAVRSQIDAIRERSLMVNHRERVIEGVLGLEYRLLDNAAFLDAVEAEAAAERPDARFYRAELVGREMTLYYVDPGSRVIDIIENPEHVFTSGWQFVNGEGTNRALNAACCLFTRFGVGVEAQATKRGFLQHSGADLAGRATALVAKAFAREIDMSIVRATIRELRKINLGFNDDTESFEATVQKWAQTLSRYKIRAEDARIIAKNAALVGADIAPRDPVEAYTNSALTTRTGYDLACALFRFARSAGHIDKLRYQQAALRSVYPVKRKKTT